MSLLAWVFGDQGGRTEYRFRVDSPKSLGEKWDKVELAMRRPNGKRRESPQRELQDWGRTDAALRKEEKP